MGVIFGDGRIRTWTGNAANNFAIMRHVALNLIRLDSVKCKG